jgi:hypothetical protein
MPIVNTYTAGDKPTILHDPDANLDYSEDWSAWLAEIVGGDTIADALILPESPLVLGSQSISGGVVTAWISGGEAGNTYRVVFRITTAAGRIDDRSIYLKVKDR